jgi:hypothetical protein
MRDIEGPVALVIGDTRWWEDIAKRMDGLSKTDANGGLTPIDLAPPAGNHPVAETLESGLGIPLRRRQHMRKLMISAGTAAFLMAAPLSALAEEATGAIQSIDVAARSITLADGSSYVLPEAIDLASLAVGQNVTVMYSLDAAGLATVTAVEAGAAGEAAPPAEPAPPAP